MNIPPFSLPSKPIKKIAMREATVADALDFCDVDPEMDETITTLFLNRVQTPGNDFVDSKTWTADDRRLGMYWYWLHTTSDASAQFRYDCGHCGKNHAISYDMRKLADGYKSMAGKPERDITLNGENIVIRPLTGADMEALELMRRAIIPGMDAKERNSIQARIRISALTRSLIFSSVGVDDNRLEANEKIIMGLGMSDMETLSGMASKMMMEMEHGLESVIDTTDGRISLILHVECDTTRSETLLRVPFRDFVYIPMV
jgi:hypothetical protein